MSGSQLARAIFGARRLALLGALALLLAAPVAACAAGGPAPPTAVPSHVPTWAYDDGCNGGTGASARLVRAWLSFAESDCGPRDHKAARNCRSRHATFCAIVQYLDATWIYADGGVPIRGAARESWWLHQPGYHDAAHRISASNYGGGTLLNQDSAAARAWFRRYLRRHYNEYTGLLMDNEAASLSAELYHAGLRSSDEIRTNRALQAAHRRMAAALTHRNGQPFLQIDNALDPNPYLTTPFGMLDRGTGVQGLMVEDAPFAGGTIAPYYSNLLDEIASVDARPHAFLVIVSYDTSGSLQARRVQAATEWLGYAGTHLVSWAALETTNQHLAVWPEDGIVPTEPLQTMSRPRGAGCLAGRGKLCHRGGHLRLQVAPGVYRREFANCFDRKVPFGQCAAIVNTTGSPVTVRASWLHQAYSHQITMAGGDVQSGGRVELAAEPFAAGTSVVPPNDALLLSR